MLRDWSLSCASTVGDLSERTARLRGGQDDDPYVIPSMPIAEDPEGILEGMPELRPKAR